MTRCRLPPLGLSAAGERLDCSGGDCWASAMMSNPNEHADTVPQCTSSGSSPLSAAHEARAERRSLTTTTGSAALAARGQREGDLSQFTDTPREEGMVQRQVRISYPQASPLQPAKAQQQLLMALHQETMRQSDILRVDTQACERPSWGLDMERVDNSPDKTE